MTPIPAMKKEVNHGSRKPKALTRFSRCRAILCSQGVLAFLFTIVFAHTVAGKSVLDPSTRPNVSPGPQQGTRNIQTLSTEKPIKSRMSAGGTNQYPLPLANGQYVYIVVDQHGIDVEVTLLQPDGAIILKVDSLNGTEGPEPLKAIAETSGTFRLDIHSTDPTADPGEYEVRIEALREPSSEDRTCAAGARAFSEAQQLRMQRTLESVTQAIKKYEEALKFFQTVADTSSEAEALFGLGTVYAALYQTEKALEHFELARRTARSPRDNAILAAAINEEGAIYSRLGNDRKAVEFFQEALSILQTLPDRLSEAIVRNNIGQFYNATDEPHKALEYLNGALPFYEKKPNAPGAGILFNNIGYAYFLMRNEAPELRTSMPLKAIGFYDKAVQIFERNSDVLGAAGTLNNIGMARQALGQQKEALQSYLQAREIYKQRGDHLNELPMLGNIGLLYESMSKPKDALGAYQEGIDILEGLRTSTTIDEIRTSLSEAASPFVYKATTLLMALRRPEDAFNMTEVARARTFLDQLGNIRPNLLKTANAQLREASEQLEKQLVLLEQRRELGAMHQDPSWRENYATAQRQYEDLLMSLKLTNPANASKSVEPLKLPQIQASLNSDMTLLSYYVLPDRTFAFVITRQSFHAAEIKVSEKDLTQKITWLRRFARLEVDQSPDLKQMYRWLITPIKQHLKTRMICIVPHRELHYLPFAALKDTRRYFGDEHTLFFVPSASALPFIQERSKPVGEKILVVAQSRAARLSLLRYVDEEADSIARLYKTKALKTGEALRSTFIEQAGEYDIIHIAAHTELNSTSPLFDHIMLAKDNSGTAALEIRDVYNLNLTKTSLVILSACQTEIGSGLHSIGDDFVALNRAFMYAGSSTVIASLWKVDDRATGTLMKAFYTRLKQGMSKADALREAQRETRRTYPNPYYWASFVLTGDPGTRIVKQMSNPKASK
jgi:CHAT domain-containing protein/Tfp pilus assembly protein PilF